MKIATLREQPNYSDEPLQCASQTPDLLSSPAGNDYYWGEVPLDEMNTVLADARQTSWKQAAENVTKGKYPHLEEMLFSESRVAWLDLLPAKPLTILDVGSGWGQTSFLMSRSKANTVVSLEQISQRAEFQVIRKEQEGIPNLRVVKGSLADVQFPPATFDLICFIGVLEWIGMAGAPASPRQVQLECLRSVRRLLRRDGVVCVGIENRIGFNNLLGAKDHSGLRFTSLLPRSLADWCVRVRRPTYRSNREARSYRTYTYTMKGYRTLFREAGFSTVDFWVAHPHYSNPRCLIQANNTELHRFFSKVYRPTSPKDAAFTAIFRTIAHLGLAVQLAPHFIIFARA